MVERVIVAVDGGEASRAALEWVLERAKTVKLELEVTTVMETGWSPMSGREDEYRTVLEEALSKAADGAAEAASLVHLTKRVRRGTPSGALISASRLADLLVIGTNKTGVLAGAVHGTLALRVAARSRCTVVVVPVGWKPDDGNVIVGWDDDGTADVALDFGAREANRLGRALRIVHSWRIPATIGMGALEPALAYDKFVDALRDSLAAAAGRIRAEYPGLEVTEMLEPGPVSLAVVNAARGAALLVVGTHGRGALGGLILGSVSHDAVLNMPAPVAVVPHPDEPILVLPEILEEDL